LLSSSLLKIDISLFLLSSTHAAFSSPNPSSSSSSLGPDVPARFRRVSRFLAARRGLIVLVCGGPCSGKSALASALAARLNLGAPVHVDALAEALRERGGGGESGNGVEEAMPSSSSSLQSKNPSNLGGGDNGCFLGGGPLPSRPPWTTPKKKKKKKKKKAGTEGEEEELNDDGGFDAEAWDREARALRAALSRDLLKAARDGRSAVIEGGGLDPGLFTGALAAPLARAWEEGEESEDEDEEGGNEEESEDEVDDDGELELERARAKARNRQTRLFRRAPAAGGPPAIVPILVTMEPEHQALLVREACERDPGLLAGGGGGGGGEEGGGEGGATVVEAAVARAAAAARHVGLRADAAAPPPPPLVGVSSQQQGGPSSAVLRVATSLRAGDCERAVARLHAALLRVMEAMEEAEEVEVGGGVDGERK